MQEDPPQVQEKNQVQVHCNMLRGQQTKEQELVVPLHSTKKVALSTIPEVKKFCQTGSIIFLRKFVGKKKRQKTEQIFRKYFWAMRTWLHETPQPDRPTFKSETCSFKRFRTSGFPKYNSSKQFLSFSTFTAGSKNNIKFALLYFNSRKVQTTITFIQDFRIILQLNVNNSIQSRTKLKIWPKVIFISLLRINFFY